MACAPVLLAACEPMPQANTKPLDDFDELIARLDELVPASHRDFLRAFEDMIELGDYAFVHAGIRPDRGTRA